jgi:uncharacterized membrane protein YdjX (TVP38/TMEM64 family)
VLRGCCLRARNRPNGIAGAAFSPFQQKRSSGKIVTLSVMHGSQLDSRRVDETVPDGAAAAAGSESGAAKRSATGSGSRTAGRSAAGSGSQAAGRAGLVRFAGLLVLLVGAAAVMARMNLSPHHLGVEIRHSGVPAPLLAIGGSALLVCFLVPRTALAFTAGTLFGTPAATLYIVLGVTLGATVSFVVGRVLGRAFVERRLKGRAGAVSQAVTKRGPWGVAAARMLPIAHFGLSNYAFGATSARLPSYLLGTVLGILPASAAYVALGAAVSTGDARGTALLGCLTTALSIAGIAVSALLIRRPGKIRNPLRSHRTASP